MPATSAQAPAPPTDAVVVGGGLAGLTAATYLARAGLSVALLEQSRQLGGRAATQIRGDFHFNMGPHALYKRGIAVDVLDELGVPYRAGTPSIVGGLAVRGETPYELPAGLMSIWRTRLLSFAAKLESTRFMASLGKRQPQSVQGRTLEEWLEEKLRQPDARELMRALFRLATYVADTGRLDAGAALAQLQASMEGVYYLDRGWRTLVGGLQKVASAAGVTIVADAQVHSVEISDPGLVVHLDETRYRTRSVILAVAPPTVRRLLGRRLSARAESVLNSLQPAQAASLGAGLRRLPRPATRFALGMERPFYFSVHTAAARLGPPDHPLFVAAKYLSAEDRHKPEPVLRTELETWVDQLQPGWREELLAEQFLPKITVTHALPLVGGRPDVDFLGLPGVRVAGDWVGREGMLADAALASAKRSATSILELKRTAQAA